jgi:hypothetical protein
MTKRDDDDATIVHGGQFYGRTFDGDLVPVSGFQGVPDLWICRRVVDYPGGRVPTGGEVSTCSRCAARIVFNPARRLPIQTPKVCLQCARITPLPIEDR